MSEYNGVLYAAPPPAGVVPNFNNPTNVGVLIVPMSVLMPLAVVFTVLRVYTRGVMTKTLGTDDYIMCLATVLSVIMAAIIFDMVQLGLGSHIWDVPLNKLFPHFMLRNLVIAMLFCAASALSKLSILIMYLRIFTAGSAFRYAVFATCAFVGGWGISTVCANIFSCSPIDGSWDAAAAATAKCINRPAFYLAQAALGIVADIATVVIPIPAISQLHMDTRKKVGVIGLLSMGGFVCIVSIIRLQSLVNMLKTPDLTRVTVPALAWCVVELNVSIIGGCIPTIKPLLKRYLPFLVSRSTYTRTKSRSNHRSGFGVSSRQIPQANTSKKSTPITAVRPLGSKNADSDSVEELVNMNSTSLRHEDKQWRMPP